MTELLHQPGFFGTSANWAADFTLVVMLVIAGLFSLGALLAKRRRYGPHRWVQTTAALLNLGMVAWMMILPFRDFVLPGIPSRMGERFIWLTMLHGLIGAAALGFGSFVTLRGHELVPAALKFNDYKRFMRVAYVLYMTATVVGVLVYLTWFVGNPNPPVYE
jgi:hypothetical protein